MLRSGKRRRRSSSASQNYSGSRYKRTRLYRPLPQTERHIRLLTILPDCDATSIVRCWLDEASLDDSELAFDALSYCWGDTSVTVPVSVNDIEIRVTANLESALRQFRLNAQGERVVLWADAVCIDQSNVEERGHQVTLMRDIYARAVTVRIWLGPSDPTLLRGMETFERLLSCFPKGTPFTHVTHTVADLLMNGDGTTFAPLAALCEVPYWNRTWIVQEAALSKKRVLYCGERHVEVASWKRLAFVFNFFRALLLALAGDLDRALDRATRVSGNAQMPTKTLCPSALRGASIMAGALSSVVQAEFLIAVSSSGNKSQTNISAMILLSSIRNRQVSDPRDHIYGTLAALQEWVKISPDYRKPVKEIFTEATVQIIETTENLDVLRYACSAKDDIPSWTPDFRVPRREHQDFVSVRDAHATAQVRTLMHEHRMLEGTLRVYAFIIDEICPDATARESDAHDMYSRYAGPLSTEDPEIESNDMLALMDSAERYRQIHSSEGATSFSTRNGHFGLMRKVPREGDCVCIIAGSDDIFSIRKAATSDEDVYRLIDTCCLFAKDGDDRETRLRFHTGKAIRDAAKTMFGSSQVDQRMFTPITLV